MASFLLVFGFISALVKEYLILILSFGKGSYIYIYIYI